MLFVALQLGLNLGVFNIAIYGKKVRCSFNSFEQCIFAPVGRLFSTKYCVLHVSQNVLYSPPYLDAVMQKHCIRKSKVSSQMYSTHLMGDACFNNIVD